MQLMSFTEAQRSMSKVVDQVEHGEMVMFSRRQARFVIMEVAEAREAYECCYSFHPEVFFGDDDGVSMWLPELDLHGEGDSIEEAQSDLLEAVGEYLEDWRDELRRYPNHASRRGWVRRLAMAEDEDDLREIIFGS